MPRSTLMVLASRNYLLQRGCHENVQKGVTRTRNQLNLGFGVFFSCKKQPFKVSRGMAELLLACTEISPISVSQCSAGVSLSAGLGLPHPRRTPTARYQNRRLTAAGSGALRLASRHCECPRTATHVLSWQHRLPNLMSLRLAAGNRRVYSVAEFLCFLKILLNQFNRFPSTTSKEEDKFL